MEITFFVFHHGKNKVTVLELVADFRTCIVTPVHGVLTFFTILFKKVKIKPI
jgi:hypothetical protein